MNNLNTNLSPIPLVYPDIKNLDKNQITNILLIDNNVENFNIFVDSVNSNTFPIVYSGISSKDELLALLQANFTFIPRIGLVFASNPDGSTKMFLDGTPLFLDEEVNPLIKREEEEPYSENVQFIINLIKEFSVKNIDYLACDTLCYSNWEDYYQLLTLETHVIVGASNDLTGNIKYGGDWVMESTSQDIEFIYFTKNIEYYTNLLDITIWSKEYEGNVGQMVFYKNYMYFPNLTSIYQTALNGIIIDKNWLPSISGGNCCIIINDYMYVSIGRNNTILKISMADKSQIVWATSTQGLSNPVSLVADENYSYLYVSNTSINSNNISKISLTNPSTDYVQNWATAAVQGFNELNCLAIKGNYLYASNYNSYTPQQNVGNICKISLTNPSTDYVQNWATNAVQKLYYPTCLVIYEDYLYVSNSFGTSVSKISLTNPSTDFISNWKTGFYQPMGITVYTNYDTNLYVYSYGNIVFKGKFVSQITLYTFPCFKEDTLILTNQGYKPIQELRKGHLVKTLKHGFKPIELIGKRKIYHPANLKNRIKDQLYKCSKSEFPEVFEPLIITGCHSILVENSTSVVNSEQIEKVKEVNGEIYLTDDKLRLPACVDLRTTIYEIPGTYTIYHLALEHDDPLMNYGIYANGLLVESCSKRFLKELSNMTLVE